MLLDSGYASVCIRRSIKQISVEDALCTEVVDAIVGIVVTICAHIVAELANLVERFRGNLRVSIHAEEQSYIEHSLDLFHFEKVAHVLNKLALKFISRLFVPAHHVSLLWENRHVVTVFFQAEASQFNDQV